MRCITCNYICWRHREVAGTTAHSNSLLLLSSKCKLVVIRTLSVDLLKFCANLHEQRKEKGCLMQALSLHALTLCISEDFFSASHKRASKSLYVLFIIFLSLWTFFFFLNFCEVFLCFLSSGHPRGSASCDAHELVATWLQIWLMTLVTSYPPRTFTYKTKETVSTKENTALVVHSKAQDDLCSRFPDKWPFAFIKK